MPSRFMIFAIAAPSFMGRFLCFLLKCSRVGIGTGIGGAVKARNRQAVECQPCAPDDVALNVKISNHTRY
jgi:hypothetical protein